MAYARIDGTLIPQYVEIIDCYPAKKQVHGKLAHDGGLVMISVREVPSSFRWPEAGEVWSATRDQGGMWMLGQRLHGYRSVADDDGITKQVTFETYPITSMEPGELRLDAIKITDALGRAVGTGTVMTGSGVYIGPDQPDVEGGFVWLETDNPPGGWTLWLDDGS